MIQLSKNKKPFKKNTPSCYVDKNEKKSIMQGVLYKSYKE